MTKLVEINNKTKPEIGVSGLLFNSLNQVLLILRNQAPAQGLWSLPGGRLEAGETMVEACRREFFEETNLDVQVKHIVAVVERQLEGFHYVIVDFLVELLDDNQCDPVPQSDVSDAQWINIDALENYNLVVGLLPIIKRTYASLTVQNGSYGLHDATQGGTDFIYPSIVN